MKVLKLQMESAGFEDVVMEDRWWDEGDDEEASAAHWTLRARAEELRESEPYARALQEQIEIQA